MTQPLAVDIDTMARDDDEVRHIVTGELHIVESLIRVLVDGETPVF